MASCSSSSSCAPTFSSPSWNYDVFLSFRGEDTRKTFVDHLYSALLQQGIDTYKDDETLRQGESIRPSLMKAIDDSQIAIIIFSKNYANSSWCLDELAHIMKYKDRRGQTVMPIFYDVEPSQVRKQTKYYGEAFLIHELENKDKVESWTHALEDAGNLSGWEPKNIANGHESKVIKEIVDEISSRLQLVTASANEKLIGIAARIQSLKTKLQIGSGGVRMIGIWGVGGGGKTTLASSIYDEISKKFDGCCFIANVREESSKRGLEILKNKILSKMEAKDVGGGRCLINMRFRNRKVLIVLDDVDQLNQLESLAGSPNWFGEGSRIIITTRDKHLLKAHKVVVHDISLLHCDEAIELFSKHAFSEGYIQTKDHEQLVKEVVSYAGGLPLALTLLGSSLCDREIHQWRSALDRLKEIPDDKIVDKLKVSFDALTKVQKDLFLDIACFFRRKKKDTAMEILDACGFHPVAGVEELREKALITILDGCFDMHDLVQEMGHYIVRGEHPKNPEKHTRVWREEDIRTICDMDATKDLDNIEAIQVDYYRFQPIPPIVAKIKNLRYIQWKGDAANALLSNVPPMRLCCLILSKSNQNQLWSGNKSLRNLKMMELHELHNLITIPTLYGLRSLERFRLSKCPQLEEIHSSFGDLDRLVCLTIEECSGIKRFPCITRLKKLETLSFARCPRLFRLSEIQQKMGNFVDEEISSAVRESFKLNPDIRLCFFRIDLRKLDLRNCNLGDEDISSAVWELPNLQELNLSANEFSRLNFNLVRTPRLKLLNVSWCACLVELVGLPSGIAVIKANRCISLKTFGDISNCEWLWKVSLHAAYNVIPLDAYTLLNSMLEGNAIKDHYISVTLPHKISMEIVTRLFRGNIITACLLPHNWYNDYYGFLIHIITYDIEPQIRIFMKQEADEDPGFDLQQESNEELDPEYDRRTTTFVGYVSFNSLRRIGCLNSTFNVISVSLRHRVDTDSGADRIRASLVPKKSNLNDPMQKPEYSEFWNDEDLYRPTFTIKHYSKSSIEILWLPWNII